MKLYLCITYTALCLLSFRKMLEVSNQYASLFKLGLNLGKAMEVSEANLNIEMIISYGESLEPVKAFIWNEELLIVHRN